MRQTKFNGVYEVRKKKKISLFTKNLVPGKRVCEERIVKENGKEYREWEPRRSKLAAAILNGISQIGFKEEDVILYLGAATGTTCSYISDILAKGFIFALDFAPRVARELVFLSNERNNIAPILADANKPREYIKRISEVDYIYQDIAQKNQAEIFLKNCRMFLKKGGFCFIAVKSRSIDVTKKPKVVFRDVRNKLERELTIVDYKTLEPFQKDHCVFVCKKS